MPCNDADAISHCSLDVAETVKPRPDIDAGVPKEEGGGGGATDSALGTETDRCPRSLESLERARVHAALRQHPLDCARGVYCRHAAVTVADDKHFLRECRALKCAPHTSHHAFSSAHLSIEFIKCNDDAAHHASKRVRNYASRVFNDLCIAGTARQAR